MKKLYKINYIESFILILQFCILNVINLIFKNFLISINIPKYIIFSILYIIPFLCLFAYIFYTNKKKNIYIDFSFKLSSYKIYTILFIIMLCIIICNNYFISLIPKNGPIIGNMHKEIEHFVIEESKNIITFFFITSILAPICEEILFRGIILHGMLKNNIHPVKAILFSSFLFGLTHMNPWQFISGFLIGSFIGFIYFINVSITDCIFLHIFNNVFASFMLLFMKNHEQIFYNFTSNYIILISCITIIILGCIFIFKNKRKWKILP
ncbi:CPBP family intramembrane glutamic endopeptidase [Blattabacterium cuenoti]|uniref:CPBP family intramembrane glutamic endopeptidase n=1 Tax=Blattabacterium cuenoti TaxID=1653831 RepID=UPI00163C2DF1|nr:type II CAAX endopeptidase family protein [Blattabacterium cuenoti]